MEESSDVAGTAAAAQETSDDPTVPASRRRGRPRSQASREAVLRAAAELMEPAGQAKLTMEGIAARAGVSKQTVYRWWRTKVDVLVEAVGAGYLDIPLPLPPDTGDLRADLATWLRAMAVEIDGGGATHLSQALVGAIATADSRSQQIHGVLVAPLRHSLHERFRTAVLAEGVDREMLAETVAAQLIMRVLFAEPITEEWIAALVELVAQERLHA
ncbi:TetR/AcrR family transcriptional regulator [Micrococcus antarcticus]|uniref:TetR/AcrR family transcriptional regulator n=1 Tax=Micrococcus antarcticus TaxID=86171 RepID=UPI00384F4641